MVNRGAPTSNLNCGGVVNLQEGYYAGGQIIANSLASQTGGATADDTKVLNGYKYWKDGVLRTGNATVQSLGGLQLWSTDITTVPFVQDGFNGYYFANHAVTLPFTPKQIILKVHTTSTTKYFSYLTSIYNLGTITSTLSLTNYNSSSGVNRIRASMSGLVLNIEVGNTGGAVGTIALIELIVIG